MDIKEVRKTIFQRDGNKCYKCGSIECLCLDHIIPKPQFQIHTVDNMLTLCLRCNFKKGIHPLPEEEFLQVEQYVLLVNEIFTNKEEMNAILKEYFTHGDGRYKNKKKKQPPRHISLERYEAFIKDKQPCAVAKH
jgi:hypothetical protein